MRRFSLIQTYGLTPLLPFRMKNSGRFAHRVDIDLKTTYRATFLKFLISIGGPYLNDALLNMGDPAGSRVLKLLSRPERSSSCEFGLYLIDIPGSRKALVPARLCRWPLDTEKLYVIVHTHTHTHRVCLSTVIFPSAENAFGRNRTAKKKQRILAVSLPLCLAPGPHLRTHSHGCRDCFYEMEEIS